VCEGVGKYYDEALAAHQMQGGRMRDFDPRRDYIVDWFKAVPGFFAQAELMAWQYRDESPYILASASESDVAGKAIRLQMVPRTSWDDKFGSHDPRLAFNAHLQTQLRQEFDSSSFCSDKSYVLVMLLKEQGKLLPASHMLGGVFEHYVLRGIEIVEALTAATRAEDLADALAWIAGLFPNDSEKNMRYYRERAALLLGDTSPQLSVPVPSRALNNEVAYAIIHALKLRFDIRLIGLVSAAHLNGKEGVISTSKLPDGLRWKARLYDGTCVDVKAVNFVHICGNYKRKTP